MAEDHQSDAVQDAAAQLETLGGARPRIIPGPGDIRIEADVTPRLARNWDQALQVLNRGTDFGLTLTDTGQVAWLRISRETGTRS
ncbi:hypothetical protein ACIQPP_49170 [Streptomyces violaceusniger]|uniref:hypothetical protein n=1 Tax=Streptomyces violaceusniger TaxID=68280 RepID=UPI0009963E47|nr:hypothetical protein [Streptomyces hygroscopicus]AQW48433.1 hypothetical protein SHXM_01896 [Streptomyces hygroscopicus]